MSNTSHGFDKILDCNTPYVKNNDVTLDVDILRKDLRSIVDHENVKDEIFSKFSRLDLFMRWLLCFFGELFSCIFHDTCVLLMGTNGSSFVGKALVGFGLNYVINVIFTRQNVGHLDPFVTIIIVISKKFPAPFYFATAHLLAQPIAAILSALLVWFFSEGFDRSNGLGIDMITPGYTDGQGLGCVVFVLFIQYIMFMYILNMTGRKTFYEMGKNYKSYNLYGFTMAFVSLLTTLVFGPIVGSNFVFYLYLFPGLISGEFHHGHWWIWFVGPIIAVLLAAICFYAYRWLDESFIPKFYKRASINKKTD